MLSSQGVFFMHDSLGFFRFSLPRNDFVFFFGMYVFSDFRILRSVRLWDTFFHLFILFYLNLCFFFFGCSVFGLCSSTGRGSVAGELFTHSLT